MGKILEAYSGKTIFEESYAEEQDMPCCIVSEAGIEAFRDGIVTVDDLAEFVGDIFGVKIVDPDVEEYYVVQFPDKWPELFTEEELQKRVAQLVSGESAPS